MDSLHSFFEKAQASDLPFVVYRKPGEQITQAYCQKDKTLYLVEDYTEEGFVFAPFDTQKAAVLFPASHSDHLEFESSDVLENHTAKRAIETTVDRQRHITLVQKGVAAIAAGKMEKVVLSRKHTVLLKNKNPYTTTQNLLLKYPDAFVYCWYHPAVGLWLGATPETLLTIKNRRLETMALAGTQVYKGTSDVVWGAKEKKEQELVTQAIVQNLSPLLDTALAIEGPVTSQAGRLLHLKTTLKAIFNSTSTSLKSILGALHPTPAICGLPRAKAKAFIEDHEGYDRNYYTGYLGELNHKETLNRSRSKRNMENRAYQAIKKTTSLYVNLRCMQWIDNECYVYVGGGITAASSPEKEWEETVNKLGTMYNILETH